MANIITYLNWRGDLDFAERPFCEADNLALAILSYLDLEQIVSPDAKQVSVRQAYERYQAKENPRFPADSPQYQLFRDMAYSRRFGTAALSCYRTVFDEAQTTQFAAVSISLGDGSCYLSFRGTDNTIVG